MTIEDPRSLWDYRRRVNEMYHRVRESGVDESSWRRWRLERDALFATHRQSPIDEGHRAAHRALPFFPYDLACRIEAPIEITEPEDLAAGHSGSGITPMVRFGSVVFDAPPTDGRARSHPLRIGCPSPLLPANISAERIRSPGLHRLCLRAPVAWS